jgi:hypothetical protein
MAYARLGDVGSYTVKGQVRQGGMSGLGSYTAPGRGRLYPRRPMGLAGLGAVTVMTYVDKDGNTLTGTESQIMSAASTRGGIDAWEYQQGSEKSESKWPSIVTGKTIGSKFRNIFGGFVDKFSDYAKKEKDKMTGTPVSPVYPTAKKSGMTNVLVIGGIAAAVGIGLMMFMKKR